MVVVETYLVQAFKGKSSETKPRGGRSQNEVLGWSSEGVQVLGLALGYCSRAEMFAHRPPDSTAVINQLREAYVNHSTAGPFDVTAHPLDAHSTPTRRPLDHR